jgi:hypothetical protein
VKKPVWEGVATKKYQKEIKPPENDRGLKLRLFFQIIKNVNNTKPLIHPKVCILRNYPAPD